MSVWTDKRHWLALLKLLLILGPILAVYAYVATKGLEAVCTEKSTFGLWCTVGVVDYVIVTLVVSRFFYQWLTPKNPPDQKASD